MPSSSLLFRLTHAAATAGVILIIAAIYLLDDPLVPAPAVVIGVLLACVVLELWRLWRHAPQPAEPQPVAPESVAPLRRWARPLAVYLIYVAALVAVYLATPTIESRWELGRQLVFLVTALATALVVTSPRMAAGLLVTHLACLMLITLQAPGPRSGVDWIGRVLYYHALPQWSGYPEIGLLLAMGASMAIALALARRPPTLRVAAAVIALTFTAVAAWIGSRSAVLTIGVTAAWLTASAAIRWRSKLATAAAVFCAAAAIWAIATGPGPVERLQNASARVSKETSIRGAGWQAALTMVRDHPVFGVGLGRYTPEYRRRGFGDDATHAYNMLLHVAADSGLVGLAAVLAIWARVLWISWRSAARTLGGAVAFAVHGALVAFFVRSQSEHFLATLWTSTRTLLLLATLVGLAEGVRRALSASTSGSARTSQPAAPPAA